MFTSVSTWHRDSSAVTDTDWQPHAFSEGKYSTLLDINLHCLSLRYRKNYFLKINFCWSVVILRYRKKQGFPGGSDSKEAACKAEDLIPGSGRSPGEGNGHPLQYSCLENPRGQRSLVGYSPRGRRSRTRRATRTAVAVLQCAAGFTSGFHCAAKWLSYSYARTPSFLDFLPMKVTTERWVEFPVLYRRFSLLTYFI